MRWVIHESNTLRTCYFLILEVPSTVNDANAEPACWPVALLICLMFCVLATCWCFPCNYVPSSSGRVGVWPELNVIRDVQQAN